MKFTVRNFGMISHADIDIKPLTVLVGPNNAGKTWLAYLFAGIFGPHARQTYIDMYSNDEFLGELPFLDTIVNNIITKGSASVNAAQFFDEQGEAYINQIAALAPTWIADYLGTSKIDFSQLEVEIKLAESKKRLMDQFKRSSYTNRLAFGLDGNGAFLTAKKAVKDAEIVFYTSGESGTHALPTGVIKEFVANVLLPGLFQTIYLRTYIFPTERTTFIGFPLNFEEETIIKDYQIQVKDTRELKAQAKPMSSAVGNFLRMTISLYQANFARRVKEAQKDTVIKSLIELSNVLQSQILGGTVDFSSPEPGPGREILFQPAHASGGLEMSVASSMVKELTPLVLYLRYLARPRELIIIDEPEMNLHPEAQAKMIEFLAMLVNAGLHVLITTHSPYMVDHLENLITASEHPTQAAKVRQQFFLQNEEAFISKEKVAVYLVDENKATNLFQEDGHIQWDTFSEISEKVIRLYPQLLEEQETEAQSDI